MNNENYSQYDKKGSNSDMNNKIKNVKIQNKEKLKTLLIDAKTEVTAKLDELKAIAKTLKECKVEKEKQIDKKIKVESIVLPPHFATTFGISIWICIDLTFTLFIFNFSIFNSFVSDPVDHHFQTFTIGDLSDCKRLCLS
jgi:hypothetical protein